MRILSEPFSKTKKATVLLLALFIVFSALAQLVSAAATPPRFITYQGRILNANSVPVSDATVDILFEFYDDPTAGSCIWSNSSATCATSTAKTITLTDGLFSENLGDTGDSYAAIPAGVFGDNAGVYLKVTIEGEALTPRKRLVAVPYALNADTLDGIGSASFFQLAADNTVTGVNNFTAATFAGENALVFEGATADDFETRFAITDPTVGDKTITFPNSTGIVALTTDLGWTDGGSVVYLTTSSDDVAIGANTAAAADFGVAPGTGIIYFGDAAQNPTLSFKDAGGADADILYNADKWDFQNGYLEHSPAALYAAAPGNFNLFEASSTVSAAASGGNGIYNLYEIYSAITNSSVEAGGYDQKAIAIGGTATNSGSGELNELRGVEGIAINTSTAAGAIESTVTGLYGQVQNNGAGSTVPLAIGVYGNAVTTAGTVTQATGVWGNISSGAGTLTTGFGGDFSNNSAGTTRYGIRASAGGGTANYAGYFHGSAVHIENSNSPSTAAIATGAGDLYMYGLLEIDGTGEAVSNIVDITNSTLTTGQAINVNRTDSGTDFTNTTTGLVNFQISDTASTGNVLNLSNSGTGASLNINQTGNGRGINIANFGTADGLYINQTGDGQPINVFATGTTDFIASFFNDGNADTNMGINIQACLDTNPTAACNYLMFKDGNGTVLGAVEGDGGGGVTNASAGSDYAELFPGTLSSFSEGDIIGLDSSGNVVLASDADEIIGAYSVAPNTLGNWFDGWRDTGVYVPVALLGQVPVTVNTEGGSISAGDYITLSSTSGVAKKATGVGYVLGQALESHSSGTGTIDVYVKPTWQAVGVLTDSGSVTLVSDDLALGATGTANASTQGMDSYGLMLRGSGWDGAGAQDVSLGFVTHVTDASEYKLSIEDGDSNELAFVNQDGDLAISGKLYPSDQGVLQTDKYIYYDGSTGLGGDFMRTNASGWGSGSYDFAEMFPAVESVSPGEVVVFANDEESVMRSTGITYDDTIAGIVSTQPGFLAGQNIDGHIPVALAGRVPTYVSAENGSIEIGDPLTTSSTPGYAMKAVEAGPIVGYAMESFSSGTGSITVFVRPSYYDGQEPDISDNELTELIPSTSLDLSGVVNLNGGSLISVSSLSGIGSAWSIDDSGAFRTGDRFVQEIETYGGDTIETYAVTSRETTIQLSGTIELEQGRAHIYFDDYDESFADVVSLTAPYRVYLTAHNATGSLYAINRENDGFIIRDTEGTSHVDVDWLVIAYHKDYEPDEQVEADVIADQDDDEVVEVDDQIEDEEQSEVDEADDQETEKQDEADESPDQETEEPVDESEEEPVEDEPSDESEEVVEEEVTDEAIEEEVVEEPIDEEADTAEPEAVEESETEAVPEEPVEETQIIVEESTTEAELSE